MNTTDDTNVNNTPDILLGASDPEMALIEGLARDCGLEVAYATVEGKRCHPGNAYKADGCTPAEGVQGMASRYERSGIVLPEEEAAAKAAAYYNTALPEGAVWVECGPAPSGAVVIDHHRPGDYGFGRGPADFLAASSIGQFVAWLAANGLLSNLDWHRDRCQPSSLLGRFEFAEGDDPTDGWSVRTGPVRTRIVPTEILLAAAGDHCPGAAYRGKCPGVDPDTLMGWRAATRAAFQKRPVEAVLADVRSAMAAIEAAPVNVLGGRRVADFRNSGTVPELPEAALRLGRATLAVVTERDGRQKVVVGGADPDQKAIVTAFIRLMAPEWGLKDVYGDPERGFAGGYLSSPTSPAE